MASWGYSTVAAAQGDQVRMLAVAAEERLPRFYPDVPTFADAGYDIVGGAYRGVAVPKTCRRRRARPSPTPSGP